MSKYIERALALLAIGIGILTAFAHYWYFNHLLLDRINNGREIGPPLGYTDLPWQMYIPLVLAVFYLLGGLLLLLNKPAGWFLLVMVSLYNLIYLLYTVVFESETEKDWLEYTIIAFILFGNSIFFALLNKGTMQKYNLSYKLVPVMVVAVIALVWIKNFI